eukprot:jgi/Mesen1/10103/ME000748S09283
MASCTSSGLRLQLSTRIPHRAQQPAADGKVKPSVGSSVNLCKSGRGQHAVAIRCLLQSPSISVQAFWHVCASSFVLNGSLTGVNHVGQGCKLQHCGWVGAPAPQTASFHYLCGGLRGGHVARPDQASGYLKRSLGGRTRAPVTIVGEAIDRESQSAEHFHIGGWDQDSSLREHRTYEWQQQVNAALHDSNGASVASPGSASTKVPGGTGGVESVFLRGLRGTAEERRQQLLRAYKGLLAMARPHNFAPSVVLVLLGAWLAAGKRAAVLTRPVVWLVAALSGVIALTSMIANDVFDFRSGVDSVNGPNKPLVTGDVHPDDAELTAGCLYAAVVLGCCVLEPLPLRLMVSAGAVATYLYTPFLKRMTLVKNVVVAAIIGSSVLAGGLVGGGMEGLQRTAVMGMFLFTAIVSREILMDVNDVAGDKGAGVMTLPVRFGQRAGVVAACALLAAAHFILVGTGPHTKFFAISGTVILLPLYYMLVPLVGLQVFPKEHISNIIDKYMVFIGGALVLLSAAQ